MVTAGSHSNLRARAHINPDTVPRQQGRFISFVPGPMLKVSFFSGFNEHHINAAVIKWRILFGAASAARSDRAGDPLVQSDFAVTYEPWYFGFKIIVAINPRADINYFALMVMCHDINFLS